MLVTIDTRQPLHCYLVLLNVYGKPLTHLQCALQVDDVPPGQVKWQLSWDQMLTAELAYHRQVGC